MSLALGGHVAASVPVLSEAAFAWVEIAMVVGIALAIIATYVTARANKRLGERIKRRRQQKREEADAAELNIDALAGRPPVPAPHETGTPDVND